MPATHARSLFSTSTHTPRVRALRPCSRRGTMDWHKDPHGCAEKGAPVKTFRCWKPPLPANGALASVIRRRPEKSGARRWRTVKECRSQSARDEQNTSHAAVAQLQQKRRRVVMDAVWRIGGIVVSRAARFARDFRVRHSGGKTKRGERIASRRLDQISPDSIVHARNETRRVLPRRGPCVP